MKLINYNRGYNNTFNCSIHGTIKMTRNEFDKAIAFLFKTRKWVYDRGSIDLYKRMLLEDLNRKIYIEKRGTLQGFLVNIRVYATQAIVEKYNLHNYKRSNYQLFISV